MLARRWKSAEQISTATIAQALKASASRPQLLRRDVATRCEGFRLEVESTCR
jgi:hypothetical protein